MRKSLLVIFSAVITLFLTTERLHAEQLFKVVVNEPSADKRAVAFVDTVTGRDRVVEVNMEGKVVWQWEFPVDLQSERERAICNGADIKYFPKSDSFLFNIPYKGAYFLKRDGSYKQVVEDDNIDHDVDLLPNGNFLYVRGFVDKGEDEVREVTPSGKIVWKWRTEDYFPDREKYLDSLHKKSRRNLKSGGQDWAHVNAVHRYLNGDTLISIRNFSMFVIVGPDRKINKTVNDIPFVHEPHETDFGFIAADRDRSGGRIKHSIVLINKDGSREKLRTGEFLTVRGIEQIVADRFYITSVGNIFEINTNGKIYHRMHLTIQPEDAERNLGRRFNRRTRQILNKGRCKPKNLYKTAKTKIYR